MPSSWLMYIFLYVLVCDGVVAQLENSTERDKRPVRKTGDNSGGMDRQRDQKSRQKAAQRKGSKRVESEKSHV